jgi:hypothetical protein
MIFNGILYTTAWIESKKFIACNSWLNTAVSEFLTSNFYWISNSSFTEFLPEVLLNFCHMFLLNFYLRLLDFYLKFYWISTSGFIELLPQVLLNFYPRLYRISTSSFIEFPPQVLLNFYLKFYWISTSGFIEFIPRVLLNFHFKFYWIYTSSFIEFLPQALLNLYLEFYWISTSSFIEFLQVPQVLLICLCNFKRNSHNFLHSMKGPVHVKSMCVFCEIKTEFLRLMPGFKHFNFPCVRNTSKDAHAFITYKMVTLSPVKSKSTCHTVNNEKSRFQTSQSLYNPFLYPSTLQENFSQRTSLKFG